MKLVEAWYPQFTNRMKWVPIYHMTRRHMIGRDLYHMTRRHMIDRDSFHSVCSVVSEAITTTTTCCSKQTDWMIGLQIDTRGHMVPKWYRIEVDATSSRRIDVNFIRRNFYIISSHRRKYFIFTSHARWNLLDYQDTLTLLSQSITLVTLRAVKSISRSLDVNKKDVFEQKRRLCYLIHLCLFLNVLGKTLEASYSLTFSPNHFVYLVLREIHEISSVSYHYYLW